MAERYLEFEVAVDGIEPRLWRRFLLHETCTFWDLHRAIQRFGDWDDDHLSRFVVFAGRRPKPIARDPRDDDGGEGPDAVPTYDELPLKDFFRRAGKKCFYNYDFGDDWMVEVKLARRVELPEKFCRRLLDGARAWPPCDCGGTRGYYRCVAAAGEPLPDWIDKQHFTDVEDTKEWIGDWRPDSFDLAKTQAKFDMTVPPKAAEPAEATAPAKLRDIVDAMDSMGEEYTSFFDRKTGEVVSVETSALDFEGDDEDEPAEDAAPGSWDATQRELVKAINADESGRFVGPPTRFDFNEWDMMRDFALSVEDRKASESLQRAISGTGAFRYFKDKVWELGLKDRWHEFRDAAYRQIAVEWCEEHGIPFVE